MVMNRRFKKQTRGLQRHRDVLNYVSFPTGFYKTSFHRLFVQTDRAARASQRARQGLLLATAQLVAWEQALLSPARCFALCSKEKQAPGGCTGPAQPYQTRNNLLGDWGFLVFRVPILWLLARSKTFPLKGAGKQSVKQKTAKQLNFT